MDDLIALFDLDGTLVDYDKGMFESLNDLQSEHEPPLTFERMHNLPSAYERRRKLVCKIPGWWLSLKEFKLGFDVLRMAIDLGFQPNILTKGPLHSPNAWKEKEEWCQTHVTPLYEDFGMNIVTEKSMVYGRVLVDDFPPYIWRWLKKRPRGLVIMPAHVYNQDAELPNIIRYDGTNGEQVLRALVMAKNRQEKEVVDYNGNASR